MCATTPTATPTPRHRLRQYRVRRAASTSSSSDSDDANDAVKPPSTRTTGRQVGRQHAEVVVEEVDGGEVASAEVKDDTDMHGPDTDFPAGGAGIRALSIAEPVGRVGEANESTRAPPTGGDAIRAAAKHATEDAETVPNALTPLHILATPSRGRGIYSPGPICSGRQLYNEGPYAAALSTAHLGTHCSGCFGSLRKVLRCTGCGVVCYCGVGCQRGDWGVHRWECAAWRAVKGRVPTTAVRVLCRLLWKRARDRAGGV
ncbi:uncharacterized protein EV422DRAFT_129647 [Fimicolochytrium jonesii]|uniref:uncharacterized protein n=1 Tax=Fimicolochytrium jonesii TaxID=1396493 RepID=UPI0022FEC1E7|nr:uncharacterized protein EV422DRAFT_129647 [Fimicolochytrium jonesii]KAI8819002.1 hypothetical protein EV422DRAFT_129647 [Fimicolochytrium jonesii]